MSMWQKVLWVCIGVSLVSCATRQDTVDRVQPNAIEKALFADGDWFTMGTVIDTDYGTPLFVGDATPFSRINFEIQEGFLLDQVDGFQVGFFGQRNACQQQCAKGDR